MSSTVKESYFTPVNRIGFIECKSCSYEVDVDNEVGHMPETLQLTG
jgi:hypothetical protein